MRFFEVEVTEYDPAQDFVVYGVSSLNNPQSNTVMFITKEYMEHADAFQKCDSCLVFWPENVQIPQVAKDKHVYYVCKDPRTEYCRFFKKHGITYYPELEKIEIVNGAYIAKGSVIGDGCKIFPGAYIGSQVVIGSHVYIGSGAKLIGKIRIGNNVVIRENAVIGADGLSTNRDENGSALTMPQFGGVTIGDGVQIGALTVIGRGAIDDTVIERGCKIDNSCFISHNVRLGEDTFVVGESIMFGSSSTGPRAYISGNAAIRDGIKIGADALVGMGAVVIRSVPDGMIVKGNPAK